jgi:hypothetical protein
VEADLEEQDEHADLGQRVDHRICGIDHSEHRSAEQDAGDQLSQHRRLADLLRERAEHLRRHQHHDEGDEQLRNRHRPAFAGGR